MHASKQPNGRFELSKIVQPATWVPLCDPDKQQYKYSKQGAPADLATCEE